MRRANEKLEAIEQRLEALEKRLGIQLAPRAPDDFEWPVKGDEAEPPEEGKVFFDDLRKRLGDVERGLISIIGGVYRFAPGKNLYWHSRISNYPLKPPLIECSDDDASRFAAVFSSTPRRRLMEAMIGAVQSSADLRAKSGLASGALYHHLRELMHVGLVEQRARGRYTLTAAGMGGIIAFLHLAHDRIRKSPPQPKSG